MLKPLFLLFLYVGVTSAQTCISASGTYCPDSASEPTPCLAGNYCDETGMTACPLNTFRATTGAALLEDCLPCPAFKAASTVGSTSCQLCQAGTYYSEGNCVNCAAGSTSLTNSTTCSQCPAGSFAGAAGSGTCHQCRPGYYQSQTGASVCSACAAGKYTFTPGSNGQGYDAVWGASSVAQCQLLPSAAEALVCLPGTLMDGAGCDTCPIGYYCPEMSLTASVRACPLGSMSTAEGAMALADCVVPSLLLPYSFETCGVAPGGIGALAELTVTAMTTSLSTNTIFVTTATAVYRLFLDSTSIELLAGQEGTTGSTANAIGVAARFTSISAIAVDLDGPEAGVIVVGDGNAVRMINVFSRVVTLVGVAGDISQAGGVALRRDQSGSRLAYVSDVVRHRIMAFNLENLRSFLVAGDLSGFTGSSDGSYPDASFKQPKGLAFIERSLNSSRHLLVADAGNGLIRMVDTDTRVVSTWFRPIDHVTPELVTPVAISVAVTGSAQAVPIVYVTEASGRVSAVLAALDGLRVLTHLLQLETNSLKAVFAHSVRASGANSAVGYAQLLVMDGTTTIKSLVQDNLALSAAAGAPGSCHLPCINSDCTALTSAALCGNSFLDAGEQCDDGFANPNSGCNMTTCTIRTGFVCAVGSDSCLEPYPAFVYAPTGVWYRAEDCSALTPTAGYTVDSHCVETDIDECVAGIQCDPMAKCLNTPGSYTCECFQSYFGDGQTCTSTAYAVYTVVDIASLASSVFALPLSTNGANVLATLEHAYATALNVAIQTSTSFLRMNATALARHFASSSLDPSVTAFTRLELVILLETSVSADLVAAQASNLAAALSAAIGSTVTIYQTPKTRVHRASSGFTGASEIEGWGMNITSVTYNRLCTVTDVTPTGGCWQVEMIYVGGQELPQSNENPNVIQQSKNVLYIPRLDHDSSMQLTAPAQALTMSSGMFFPCDVATTAGITPRATACCLRNIESSYRPHAGFADFLNSDAYNAAAPLDTCTGGGINDTFPRSDIVFTLPEGSTNDLVVGKIEGMPHSEVRLLETIDYTTRTFRVLLVLEEGDLRMGAALTDGIWGLDYNLTFFVGLANFKGTGTSIMNTRNSVEFITVSKSSTLTISTYGANQDPLVSSVDMQLKRIKVTDFFQPVKYLYYLQPVFTLPANFRNSPSGSIVPTNSIRLIKTQGLPSHSAVGWQQACASTDGEYIYANASLQALVQKAQAESCVQSNLQMCYPPSQASSVISFGIPLPLDFLQSSDYSTSNPYTLNVEFVVQAYDTKAMTNVYSTLALSVDITPLGFTAICETMSASQNLADIISGNIYIGTATSDVEWDSTLQKKTNIDVPGTVPSASFEFAATTVQGAVMTFAALGDPAYFEDPRSLNQNVHIHDLHTVHFLEPLGSKSGPTPSFDAVKALFLAGTAFIVRTDAAQHSEWLEPSPALLAICPYRATAGKMSCLTRTESTFKNTVVTRDPNYLVELRQNDEASITEMKNLMSRVILQGGVNDFTNQLGSGFYTELSSKLTLNNRYRKAYVVNPIMDWTFEAMQGSQLGSTSYTVCTKILAIGMITIRTPDGTQLARRLLSTELLTPSAGHARRMLQSGQEPSMTQTGNSVQLNLDVPGYDAASQLCTIVLNAPYSRCNIVQLQTRIEGAAAKNICYAQQHGTLASSLQNGMISKLQTGATLAQIQGVALLEYSVDGCLTGATTSTDYTIVTQRILVSSVNGSATLDVSQIQYLADFFNTTTWTNILGGGGYISFVTMTFTDSGGKVVDITIGVKNATRTGDQAAVDLNKNLGDRMFVYDYSNQNSAGGRLYAVLAINLLTVAALLALLLS